MFSLQEYQHVYLLWFKKRSFTLVWKPNPPLRSASVEPGLRPFHTARKVEAAHLHSRADAASESTMGARCSRSAYALPLLCLRCETGVNQALLKRSRWKRFSSRDQWKLSPATMCCGWQRARFGAAQTMHSHKCNHVKFLLAHSQFTRSLEPCYSICGYIRVRHYSKLGVGDMTKILYHDMTNFISR